ncbi:diguanylate cyclase [Pseudoduganella plicata]|uniref:diguanylate cyclase n=2 Tax=Pseudoduganella plicata TaxID=321984 RepID=A0ABX5S932_9BURK|nr:GGDEF domain-containing protein [Pseudoduganella plicata]QBQ36088.1 GGDEF domain-containing protein [Pseudoduganella plicata]
MPVPPSLPRLLRQGTRAIALAVLVWLAGPGAVAGATTAGADRHVLVLYSWGADSVSVWQRLMHKGLYDELGKNNWAVGPGVFEERFDANRISPEATQHSMAPYLRAKYGGVRLDAVIAENQVASRFLDSHPDLFPGVPRYYVNHGRHEWQPDNGTALEVRPDFARSIGIIAQVAPRIRKVVVIADGSPRLQQWLGEVRRAAARYEHRIDFEYHDRDTFAQLEHLVGGLDRNSAVFLLPAGQDATGARITPPALARRLAAASSAPIFTSLQSLVQPGVVGGYVVSAERIGRVIARIMLGQPTDTADVQGYYFDYPTVRRFGLGAIPPDAVLLNRPDNVWDLYRWQIIAGVTLIGVQGALIAALFVALRDRRHTLADLHNERNNLEDRVLQRTLELLMANTKLEQLATTDPLTGIANRRKMTDTIAAELERASRFGHPLSVLMVDVDYFKRVNDTHGHEVGDRTIVAVANVLMSSLRAIDTAARFGGEEFVVLMPETDEAVAAVAAERLREAAGALRLTAGDGTLVAITVTIGISSARPDDSPSTLLVRADKALYRGKKEGRNRVVRFEDVATPRLPA